MDENRSALEKCPGCGAMFSPISGPIHPYMESSPTCWASYGTVLALEYGDPEYLDVYRLGVDAYAVQHPGQPSRQSIQSVGVHLIRLCLLIEHNLAPEDANDAILAAGEIKRTFTWLDPPASRGDVTVKSVAATESVAEHKRMVRSWAESAWMAWEPHHPVVRSWLSRTRLGRGPFGVHTEPRGA